MAVNRFYCLGPETGNCKQFHSDGFVKSSFRKSVKGAINAENKIILFGKEYAYDTALIDYCEVLFDCCRKAFLLIHGQLGAKGPQFKNSGINHKIRDVIALFLNYVLEFIETSWRFTEIPHGVLSSLETQLFRLRHLYHRLSFVKLPQHVLAYYGSMFLQESNNPTVHLVHCHLEFRWQFIRILAALNKAKTGDAYSLQLTQTAPSSEGCVEEEILLVMNEMLWMAIARYEKADKGELASFPAFSCVCVKELWFLLIQFPYAGQDFWVYFHQTLRVFLENKALPTESVKNSSKIEPMDYLPCSNRNEFVLWFMTDLTRLLGFDAQGNYLGVPANDFLAADTNACGHKFEVVDDVIRELLSDEEGPSEAVMRTLMPLITKVQSASNHLRSGPILHLWEYFFKKFNSGFYIPGSTLNSTVVMSKTGAALLEDVKSRLDGSFPGRRENSFLMYLRMLGKHLIAVRLSGGSSARLFSRVFIKFSANRQQKLKDLLEQGVFHMACLHLTLALGSGNASIIHRLVELLSAIPRTDGMKDGKHEMIWKAYVASLIALEEMHADLTGSAALIIQHVDWCVSLSVKAPLAHLIEGFNILFQQDVAHVKGLHQLFGPWIANYLKICGKTEVVRLLCPFVTLLKKLKTSVGVMQPQCLRSEVEQFLIPILSQDDSPVTAELAALCALCAPRSKFDIFSHWNDHPNSTLSGKFLATLIEYEQQDGAMQFPRLPISVQQTWVRCCFIWGPGQEVRTLSHYVSRLPLASGIKIDWMGPEPFREFLAHFGIEYSMCQTLSDKGTLRTTFLSFFPKFDKWLETQCKTIDQLDENVIGRIYEYSSILFARCAHLIYSRSDSHCLLKVMIDHLVLPHSIYKPEFKQAPRVFAAIIRFLGGFLEGLLALDPARDPYINRLVRDVVMQYLPRLCDVAAPLHPLVPLLCGRGDASNHILQLLIELLQTRPGSPSTLAATALQLFLKVALADPAASHFVFKRVADVVVELLIQLDANHVVSKAAMNYLNKTLDAVVNRTIMLAVLSDSCKKHMELNAASWFAVVERVAPLVRAELEPLVPLVTQVMEDIEKRRGVQHDPILRQIVGTLNQAVGKRTTNQHQSGLEDNQP